MAVAAVTPPTFVANQWKRSSELALTVAAGRGLQIVSEEQKKKIYYKFIQIDLCFTLTSCKASMGEPYGTKCTQALCLSSVSAGPEL